LPQALFKKLSLGPESPPLRSSIISEFASRAPWSLFANDEEQLRAVAEVSPCITCR
jgi:hypothetical protein